MSDEPKANVEESCDECLVRDAALDRAWSLMGELVDAANNIWAELGGVDRNYYHKGDGEVIDKAMRALESRKKSKERG